MYKVKIKFTDGSAYELMNWSKYHMKFTIIKLFKQKKLYTDNRRGYEKN